MSTLRYEFAMAFCDALCGRRHDRHLGTRLDMVVKYPQQKGYSLRELPTVHVEIEMRELHREPVQVHAHDVAEYITSLHAANAALTSEVQALRRAAQVAAKALNDALPPDLQPTAKPA